MPYRQGVGQGRRGTRYCVGKDAALPYHCGKTMNEVEKSILDSLLELQQAAVAMRTASPKPDLVAIFKRLDELAHQLPKGSDPQLRHYLQNKSYEKARLLLTGRGAENVPGSCGNH